MAVSVSSEGHVTALRSQICACHRGYGGQSYKTLAEKQWPIKEILNQIRCNILHWFIATELTVVVEGTS